jgi:hypothetical protein
MANSLRWGKRAPLLLALPVFVLPLLLGGQRSSVPPSRLQAHQRQPQFQDWSTRHTLYSRYGTMAVLEAASRDPRAQFRWRESERRQLGQLASRQFALQSESLRALRAPWRPGPGRFPARASTNLHTDWAINLGAAGTAPSMYPAKYSFDVNAAASCTNDFVVFPVNSNGSSAQPNLVAFNYLYSGTAGVTGVCDTRTTPGGHSETKSQPRVLWSYNIQGITGGGAVATSPVLSLDGAKIAFVETKGSAAHFHVLAWRSGDGQDNNLENVLVPATITTFVTSTPAVGSGTATDLSFGAAGVTLSSPYIDYAHDTAYVGNDAGILFRFKNIFCPASCSSAVPSLDTSWGTSGSVTVCSGKLTGPIQAVINNNIYVGCSDGKLYSVPATGIGTIKSLTIGDGVASKTFGAIVDPPIVDSSNGFVYAVSGSASNGTIGVLVQATLDFSSSVAVPIGNGNQCNLHAPTVNNAYFTSPISADALIYIGGVTGTVGTCTPFGATGGTNQLYGATFGAGGVLSSGAPAHSTPSANGVGNEYAPLTEFFNTNTATDYIFVSVLRTTGTVNNMYSFNSTNGWAAIPLHSAITGLGASGIVVDNVSASNQASSFYLNALNQNSTCTSPQTGTNTNGCATKLTQGTFQ